MYIMVTGSMPYDDSNVKRMVKDQTEKQLGFSRSRQLTADCKDLILRMLNPDPTRRAGLYTIQHHAWVLGPEGQTTAGEEAVQLDKTEESAAPRPDPTTTGQDPGGHGSSGSVQKVIQTVDQEQPARTRRAPFNPKFVPI